eukprot:COSAG01_NODE_48414_length_381_cov_1.283688_1_plen_44_part_01
MGLLTFVTTCVSPVNAAPNPTTTSQPVASDSTVAGAGVLGIPHG